MRLKIKKPADVCIAGRRPVWIKNVFSLWRGHWSSEVCPKCNGYGCNAEYKEPTNKGPSFTDIDLTDILGENPIG